MTEHHVLANDPDPKVRKADPSGRCPCGAFHYRCDECGADCTAGQPAIVRDGVTRCDRCDRRFQERLGQRIAVARGAVRSAYALAAAEIDAEIEDISEEPVALACANARNKRDRLLDDHEKMDAFHSGYLLGLRHAALYLREASR